MERCIVHIDLDSFFVSAERLKRPELNGKPVIVGGTVRGVVASCSYEARAFGIHSAMPIVRAKKLCPHGIFLRGTNGLYQTYSEMVTEIIAEEAPLFQKSSIDEFYLDLTGMEKYIGTYRWACKLRNRIINETGLPISFGMSVNKLVAKIATGFAKPNGTKYVQAEDVQTFLNALPVNKIPGIGEKTARILNVNKIFTIKDLYHLDQKTLEQKFGKHGLSLYQKSRGICNAPIVQYRKPKSMSAEVTFKKDINNVKQVEVYLTALINKLCFQLRKKHFLSNKIAVKIRYSDFTTTSKQMTVENHADEQIFRKAARKLFYELYRPPEKIRLIGVCFSQLNQFSIQLNLFEDETKKMQLKNCMDSIREKFGADKLTTAYLK